MFRRARTSRHPTRPLVDAYIASLPRAINDETLETLASFQQYAMSVAGELLDESMHDIINETLDTLGRDTPPIVRYLMTAPLGGGMLLCGATVDAEVNATTQPAGDGYVILITERLLVLMTELAHLHTAVSRFAADDGTVSEPVMSLEQASQRMGLVAGWAWGMAPFPATAWDFDEDRAHFATVVYDETVAFVLAHELAHVLLGHFARRKTEFREFARTVPEATPNDLRAIEEIDADALAARLTARRTTRLGRQTHHLGALFFFEISYMLELAATARREESLRQAVRRMQARARITHPHPLRRLDLAIRAEREDHSEPMELCDGALATFDTIWHGPRPERSAAAVANLERRAVGVDPERLNRVFGTTVAGFRRLVPDDVRHLLEAEGEAGAAVWVSFAALSYLSQVGLRRRCVSGEHQLRLYVLFGAFSALYLGAARPSPEAVALDSDVRAAIPELDTIMDVYAQVVG